MNWQDDALCAEVGGDAWFPEGGTHGLPAKALCAVCPVRAACLEYALTHDIEHGVWGGLGVGERAALKRVAA